MTNYTITAINTDNKELNIADTQRKTKRNMFDNIVSHGSDLLEFFPTTHEFNWDSKSKSYIFTDAKGVVLGWVAFKLNEEKNKAASNARYEMKAAFAY